MAGVLEFGTYLEVLKDATRSLGDIAACLLVLQCSGRRGAFTLGWT